MLIHIDEASHEFTFSDIPTDWIAQQLNNRRRAGVVPCVKIQIDQGGVDFYLSVGPCPGRVGSPRKPSQMEQRVFDYWNEWIENKEINPGLIISFLRHLPRIL